jgi:hypothetical protein
MKRRAIAFPLTGETGDAFAKVCPGHRHRRKSPLILSFSPQARLGEHASQIYRVCKQTRLGEGTPEMSPSLAERAAAVSLSARGEGRSKLPLPLGRGLGWGSFCFPLY